MTQAYSDPTSRKDWTMKNSATQEQFLDAYRAYLIEKFEWARHAGNLDVFIRSVRKTLNGGSTWIWQSEGSAYAWRKIGMTGKMSLKRLRALPGERPEPGKQYSLSKMAQGLALKDCEVEAKLVPTA